MESSSWPEKAYLGCLLIGSSSIFLYFSHDDRMNESLLNDDHGDAALENLYPALVQCFTVILCGYTAGRLNMISRQEAKGLNTFVSTFALPCLIFLSLAELDLTSVNWIFLASILVSKSIVFFSVIIITFCITRPISYGKPGLYAIFCTQSNDFAIGYPILLALYGKTHPDYPSYLYLMAPISLAILNPIAFVLLEIERQQRKKRKSSAGSIDTIAESTLAGSDQPSGSSQSIASLVRNADPTDTAASHIFVDEDDERKCPLSVTQSQLTLLGSVIKSIISNPIVFMTVLGIIGNFFYSHLGFVSGVLQVFGSAFSATALFVLGLRMVGTVQKMKGDDLLVIGVLIAVKLLVLPLVTREVTSTLHTGWNSSTTLDLSTFGFLYGTFPTAPAVFVFSTQYNLEVDLISSGMVACTFISAPLMFISAKMTALDSLVPERHYQELESFGYDLSIAGLIVGTWLIILFVVAKKISQIPHRITTFLIASQAIICFGALLQPQADPSRPWTVFVKFAVLAFGIYSARIWTAILAVSLLMMQSRSLCFVLKLLPYFVLIGWGIPIIVITVIGLTATPDYNSGQRLNPYFIYGNAQAYTTLVILVITFLVTSGCLVVQQRCSKRQAKYLSLVREVNSKDMCECDAPTPPARPVVDIEELGINPIVNLPCGQNELCNGGQCSEAAREICSATLREYRNAVASMPEDESEPGDPQLMRHLVLLLLLTTSMFVGIMVAIWTLVVADVFSGIYVELAFLDVTLNTGQICLTFAVFGLEAWSVVSPIVNSWRRLWYGADTIVLPPIEELSFETTHVCHQFIAHHLSKCEQDLSKNIRFRLVVYRSCFKGSAIVEWLINKKLTKDRLEASTYASHLVTGRVLRHVENRHHFVDSNLLYTFSP